MRARVGALPQQSSKGGGQHDDYEHLSGGRGKQVRVQTGMSLEDLKRQTAHRLAQEGGQSEGGGVENNPNNNNNNNDEQSSDAGGAAAAVAGPEPSSSSSTTTNNNMHYQQLPHPLPQGGGHPYPLVMAAPQHAYPQPQRGGGSGGGGGGGGGSRHYAGPPSYGYDGPPPPPPPPPPPYGSESRNYTDSQLGVGGGGGGGATAGNNSRGGNAPQFGSPAPPPPGVGKGGYHRRPVGGGQSTTAASQKQQQQQPLQQQQNHHSTPRMPRHATVLKDRGSTENSVGSDPSGGSDSLGYGGYAAGGAGRGGVGGGAGGGGGGGIGAKTSPPSMKGRTGSHGRNLNKSSGKSSALKPKEMRTPNGRHTPVKDHHHNMEGQVLFATPTPNQRRSAPTASYSEPLRRNRPHQNMSPNYNRMRSPDHQGGGGGGYSKGGGGGGGGGYYGKNQLNKHQNHIHQSKLPHGLTVQELKEMTRARLAAEAEVAGPEGSSDQSVHSAGTHGSSKGSDQFSLGRGAGSNLALSNESATATRNLLQSNESIRREYSNQGLSSQSFQGQQQMQQMQQQNPNQYNYPRHPSPVFGSGGLGPNPNQFNGNQPTARQLSPAFGLSSSQTRSQGEAWETASATSSTLAPEYHAQAEPAFPAGNGSGGAAGMPFSSPMNDSNDMTFNRGRCFSAGAAGTTAAPPSFEQYQAAYYDHVPMTSGTTANRQRCATVSPPGMSRLHEDRPYLFSTGDKDRLAIPPLSEPRRRRLHTTDGLNIHGTTSMRGFNSSVSPAPPNAAGGGSAFVPIGKSNDAFLPQSPPPLSVDRTKFNAGDRALSIGSTASGHGDLPSSMAEAVLASITSTSGAPIMGDVIGTSPFRSTKQEMMVGESPFRVSSKSDNASSAFRMDSLLPESSDRMSLFLSGESRNHRSPENLGERLSLGTHSWGGIEDETGYSNTGLSHDFSNLLNFSGDNLPPVRGRAATEPVWFGGNDPPLLSRIDPEHNGGYKGPPRVSSLDDTNDALANSKAHNQQGRKSDGY